jgi:hypothetical protein
MLSDISTGNNATASTLHFKVLPSHGFLEFQQVSGTFNFFDEALCEILGGGDVRGRFDHTTGARPSGTTLDRPAIAAQPLSLRT